MSLAKYAIQKDILGITNTMRINFSYPTKDEIVEGVKRLGFVVKKYLTEKKKNTLKK